MAGPSGSPRKKPRVPPGDGDGADHITGLPLELRARIASFIPFRQVGQLSSLSRPWRRIHDHTPVVQVDLDEFLRTLDEDALAGLRGVFRRCITDQGLRSCKVDVLRIAYDPEVRQNRHHAARIIRLTDAREILINLPDNYGIRSAWALVTPPSARDLQIAGFSHMAPAVSGPGAAALLTLSLQKVTLLEWPRLPNLRSFTLTTVIIEARLPSGAWCPRLEYLCMFGCGFFRSRVDFRLPLLKTLDIDHVLVGDPDKLADVTVDCPELEKLDVCCTLNGSNLDYRSFTARVPRLRHLTWHNQFAERVDVDFGKPSSVTSGSIKFTWKSVYDCHEMKECQAMMMQMLGGLLPHLPPIGVTNAARPYLKLDKYMTKEFGCKELFLEERLTCNLNALMSSQEV